MQNTQRQVLALIETSSEFGRGVLKGILNYTQALASKNLTPWHVRLEPCNVCEKVPGDFALWHGDGIISQSNSTDIYRQLQKKKVPIVEMLNNDVPNGVDIDFDFEEIAKIAAMHFCDRGLTNIAWYAVNNVWWCNRLRDFFVQELRKQDRKCFVYPDDVSTEYEYHRPYWNDARHKSLTKWLKKLTYPVGILAASDMLAVRIIEACKELELDVPNQVAVLGVSNDSLTCSLSSPQLSSIDLDAERHGYLAAELLDKKMNGNLNALPEAPVIVSPKGAVAR
ncbi:MAG: XylR family transcriptional regulator, partial [Thermoguttaceae bacterium]|nr:XylR family transcriptional regulator [Thermoguttaceae bacterium]